MDEVRQREIAAGLLAGRAEAWQALYDDFCEPVWRSVARLVGPSSADVADVVQETFLAAARSACSFDASRGSLWMWLCGIARRQVALHYRKQGRRDRLRAAVEWLASSGTGPASWLESRDLPPDEVLASAELANVVRAALAELPADYQHLLIAKYLDGQSVEEICTAEKTTAEAVRSKLARARRAFKEAFATLRSQFDHAA